MLKDLIAFLPSIHKEGYLFIGIFAVITLLMFQLSDFVGVICLILTIWCVCFFRDPDRVTPQGNNLIVSPADGQIINISDTTAPAELDLGDKEFTKVSIFLSVFDVHVNRIPISGRVKKLHYNPGKFINASFDKASEFNERQTVLIETDKGFQIPVVQIAGLVARRIVCHLDENQEVKSGDRFGIIRFGSRVDVYLPKGTKVDVLKGQRAVAGETVIAKLKSNDQK
jgi:phosphatidylserine decarboxylase